MQKSETERLTEILLDTIRPKLETHALGLIRASRALCRLAEVACCREMQPDEVKREEQLEECVLRHCDALGITCHIDGDPRGFVVKLHGLLDSYGGVKYNTFGGAETGYGIGEAA